MPGSESLDWAGIAFTIVMLIILTLIFYLASGLASADWEMSPGMWLRFIVVAAIAAFLIPALQAAAGMVDAADLSLLIAFVVIMFMIKFLIVPELAVSDEWMTTIFASLLAVIIVYLIQRIVDALFNVQMFSFI